MSIQSEVQRLREVFTANATLRVPPYQRGFSWTQKEVTELVRDLVEAYAASTIYFLGAMVLIQPKVKGPADVVDGQQRLTTLTILLSVLRDQATSSDEEALLHTLIGHADWNMLSSDRHRWRLALNHLDTKFFRTFVQARGATRDPDAMEREARESGSESQQKLAAAVRHVQAGLEDIAPEERKRFTQWLLDEVSVVKVRVTENNIAYKVFLVLNQRGLPLSDHDILKSALLERSGFTPKEAIQHSQQWNIYATRLGSEAFEDLLKQVRAIYDRQMKGEFIDALLAAIGVSSVSVSAFIHDALPKYVEAYEAAIRGTPSAITLDSGAERCLIFLRSIQHEQWRAPAIKFLTGPAHTAEDSARFFSKLERLAYMLQYTNTQREYRHRRYRRVMDAIDNETWDKSPGPLDLSPEEKASFVRRLRGKFPNYPQRRALLMRINACAPNGVALAPDADATVEHILPRSAKSKSDWGPDWPDPQEVEELTETLGNFTLLTRDENTFADSKLFPEKIEIFFAHGEPSHALTSDLRGKTLWTAADVRERGERLVGWMIREWELA